MKNVFLLPACILFYFAGNTQTPDATYTDCNGNTESIYGIIGQGAPLIIASKGFDCSICMSQAPALKTFSEQHPEIRIWGAMGFRYSNAQPSCAEVNDWKNDYAWNEIFMFPDVNEEWEGAGYPTYYVISPFDSSIQYEGASFSQASAKALELVPTGIFEKPANTLKITYDAAGHAVQLSLADNMGIRTALIANLQGQIMLETFLQSSEKTLRIPLPGNITNGIYLLLVRFTNGKMYPSTFAIQ